jgi:hypothetical protein
MKIYFNVLRLSDRWINVSCPFGSLTPEKLQAMANFLLPLQVAVNAAISDALRGAPQIASVNSIPPVLSTIEPHPPSGKAVTSPNLHLWHRHTFS